MLKSSVVDNASGKSVDSTVRTSTGTFLAKGADDVVARIEKRVAQVTMIPLGEWNVSKVHHRNKALSFDVLSFPDSVERNFV